MMRVYDYNRASQTQNNQSYMHYGLLSSYEYIISVILTQLYYVHKTVLRFIITILIIFGINTLF
jgi:hypothetical protein